MLHTSIQDLQLRPFEEADAPQFVEAVLESVDSVGPWMPWCHAHYTLADALDWFKACHAAKAAGSAYEFGIFSNGGTRFVGGAGLNQLNTLHAVCNLGYWVRQSEHRKGVALACVAALADWGFDALKLQRIEIVVAVGNAPSYGVAQKSGALHECVARNRLMIRGQTVAADVFSLVPKL